MKTTEQKAKAYDEAIEKIKYVMEHGVQPVLNKEDLREIFPEIQESEDDGIRKEIISALKWANHKGVYDKHIAWLEKQGGNLIKNGYTDNKDFIKYADKYSHEIWHKLMDNFKNIKDYNIGCNDVSDIVLNAIIDTCNWLEKKGEKPQGKTALEAVKEKKIDNQNCVKSDDKVEEHLIPTKGIYYTCIKDYYSSDNTHLCVKGNVYKSSFNGYIDDESHFGLSWTNSCAEKYFEPTQDEDWIVCEHDNVIGKPVQYKEFKKKVNQKFIENLKAEGITPKLRLWTIEDAKDGDILASIYNKPFIYNGNHNSTHVGAYCGISTENRFNVATEKCRWTANVNIRPATKEQSDALLTKMREAGYEWDAEKKELKKVEPKFKVGQWIVFKDKYYKVNYNGCGYELVDQNGLSTSLEYGTIDKNAGLWDITKDAKDGDVIFYSSGWTCIFKCIHGIWYSSYCFITADGEFHTGYEEHSVDAKLNGNANPATKEQRDTLMKAIADAGYTFDFEKKELKKIEQKKDIYNKLTDFESSLKHIMEEAIECGDTHNLKADADMLLRLVQKPAWSEEDESILQGIWDEILANKHDAKEYEWKTYDKFLDWLKSLKDRVQPQLKQEWSEEDERMMLSIEQVMNCASLLNIVPQKINKVRTWLKSIKERII